jgi:hypothetical protein
MVALASFVLAGKMGDTLNPSTNPLEIPAVPIVAVVGLLVATLPAWFAPMPPTLATVSTSVAVAA